MNKDKPSKNDKKAQKLTKQLDKAHGNLKGLKRVITEKNYVYSHTLPVVQLFICILFIIPLLCNVPIVKRTDTGEVMTVYQLLTSVLDWPVFGWIGLGTGTKNGVFGQMVSDVNYGIIPSGTNNVITQLFSHMSTYGTMLNILTSFTGFITLVLSCAKRMKSGYTKTCFDFNEMSFVTPMFFEIISIQGITQGDASYGEYFKGNDLFIMASPWLMVLFVVGVVYFVLPWIYAAAQKKAYAAQGRKLTTVFEINGINEEYYVPSSKTSKRLFKKHGAVCDEGVTCPQLQTEAPMQVEAVENGSTQAEDDGVSVDK